MRKFVRSSLRASFWDGFFASIQIGIIDQFITPIALFMGAGNAAIGILNFVRNTLVSMLQMKSADITLWVGSRRKFVLYTVFMAAILWIPTYFVPFMFNELRIPVFIVLFSITSAFNMISAPAWASLMGEYLPPGKRGRYFGWRGTVLGIVYSLSVLLAGVILYFFYSISLFWGFGIIVIIAAVARLISWVFLTGYYEPRWRHQTENYFSLFDFVRRFPQSNFARFSVFYGFLLTGVALASPFFAVYVLEVLKFDYLHYTLLMGAAVCTTLLTQQYWGNFADKYGNMKIIKLTSVLIAIIPFCWLFSRDFAYLFLLQLCAGFVWAGNNLCSANFIYDVALSSKRERCIAYFNFLSGFGQAIGALLGGFSFRFLPPLMGTKFLTLFLISGCWRVILSGLIILFTREVRNVTPVRIRGLLLDLSGLQFVALLSKELLIRQKKK